MSSSVDEEMINPDAYGMIEMKRADLDDPDHDWSRLNTGGECVINLDDGNRVLIETRVAYTILAEDGEVLDLSDPSDYHGIPVFRRDFDPSYPESMIEEVRGHLAAHEASPGDFADPTDNPNKED